MKDSYKELYRQAERLHFRFQDKVDAPQSDKMQALKRDIRQVMEDLEQDKNPRSVEERVKQVMRRLKDLEQHGGELMDHADADELHDQYEDLREDLRKLPDY